MTIKEQICEATDAMVLAKRTGASYDDLKAIAVRILELRQQAEKAFMGRIKTKITPVSIASLIR